MKNTSSRPFLKWVGGKTRLIPSILPLLPNGHRLIEPFVGAGSIFLASEFENLLLADINPVLIALYKRIQSDDQGFLGDLRPLFSEEYVYCDPPYADQNDKASFNAYGAASFNWSDQIRLANKARNLASKGITVVISNHDTDETRNLYSGATLHHLSVRRSVAAASSARGQVQELVAVFSPSA